MKKKNPNNLEPPLLAAPPPESLASSPEQKNIVLHTPVKIYPNSEIYKDQILSDNKNKSGIYMWTNIINNKKYVGSAQDLSDRLSFYYSQASINSALQRGKSYIYSALLKDGHPNFSLEIIEYCEPSELLIREKYYIDLLGSEYNILKDPTIPPMSGRTHSDATKTIMSDIKKGNTYGYKKGQPRPVGSGKPSQQIEVTDIKNNTITSYNSFSEAAKALNLPSHKIISEYIKRNQKKPYKGQYTFKKL
jgi:hypothetical protein